MGELPVLEAAGAVGQPERVGVGPVRAAHVDEQREGTALEHAVGHIEEPDAAGAAHEFPPGGGEVVALELGHVHRHLSDALAGVNQVWHAQLGAHQPHRAGILHQA